jgi:hypothetical protein
MQYPRSECMWLPRTPLNSASARPIRIYAPATSSAVLVSPRPFSYTEFPHAHCASSLARRPWPLPSTMAFVTPETLQLTQSQSAAAIRTQLLVALCVGLLFYGIFAATTFLTIRTLLLARRIPYESKYRWNFVIVACAMFIIGTSDATFTIWINFLATLTHLDDPQTSTQFMTNYNFYNSAHVRYIPTEVIKLD